MSNFIKAVPVLAALNLKETIDFYKDKLGFKEYFLVDNYGGVSQGELSLHFWLCQDRRIAENTSCRIELSNVEAFYKHCQKHSIVHPNGQLCVQDWGSKEFAILDNNGNLIWFYELL